VCICSTLVYRKFSRSARGASKLASCEVNDLPRSTACLIPLHLIPNALDPCTLWLILSTSLSLCCCYYYYHKKSPSFLFTRSIIPLLCRSLYKWRRKQESAATLGPIHSLDNRKSYSGLHNKALCATGTTKD